MKQLLLLLFLCTPIISSESATSSTGTARRKSPAEILTIIRNFKADPELQFKTTAENDNEGNTGKKITASITKKDKENEMATIHYSVISNSQPKITLLTRRISYDLEVVSLVNNACSTLLCMALLDCLKIAGNDTPCHFYPELLYNFPTKDKSEPSRVLYYNSQCTISNRELDPWICLAEKPIDAPLYRKLLIQQDSEPIEDEKAMM